MSPQRSYMSTRGFTLIELMVTLAVAAILMTIAAPSFLAFQRNSELTSAANGLVATIAAARGEAMKSGMYAMIVPADGAAWSSGWVAFIDKDANRAFTASADQVISRQAALASYFTVSSTGTANESPPYIMFDGSGYPKTTSNGFGQLTFSIARSDVLDSARPDQTRNVMISVAGRIRSCKPASDSDPKCRASDNDD
ncbi:putative major pilin subunit [Variovorax sp. PBS-H4]|uniref:GspH/FimT family pseudopilin n=1 Tax=Variovorax sp. PBS-H4 TaxID=434008 RepID=UPI0013179B66|nr:GspH/FimT family pseudopilin [Variovorax sp. PBS-H4]VTU33769.1 putative major pilin subunit [Variovorax sp. PBS-H4]